jgi:hypothetical protein
MAKEGRVIALGYTVLNERQHAVDYHLSMWGDYFINNPTLPHTHEVYPLTHVLSMKDILGSNIKVGIRHWYMYNPQSSVDVVVLVLRVCIL